MTTAPRLGLVTLHELNNSKRRSTTISSNSSNSRNSSNNHAWNKAARSRAYQRNVWNVLVCATMVTTVSLRMMTAAVLTTRTRTVIEHPQRSCAWLMPLPCCLLPSTTYVKPLGMLVLVRAVCGGVGAPLCVGYVCASAGHELRCGGNMRRCCPADSDGWVRCIA